ncbi:hypothetical protein ACHQM5_018538 [Ranunculus cassubicifolius]
MENQHTNMEIQSDWRTQFKRRKMIRDNIIVENNELLNKMLESEEKLFVESTSQSDYLKGVSSKMMAMGMSVGNVDGDQCQDSASQSSGDDWREKAFEKIQIMKDLYLDKVVQMFDDVTRDLRKARENEVDGLRHKQYFLVSVAKILRSRKEDINASQNIEKFEKNLPKFFTLRDLKML